MALNAQFTAKQSAAREKLTVYDVTGIYNSVDNLSGWGGVNPNYNQVAVLTIQVIKPDPSTLQPSTDASMLYTLNGISVLPNVIGTGFDILATSLGYSTGQKLIDGVYDFVIAYSGAVPGTPDVPFSGTQHFQMCFINGYGCCVDKTFAGIKDLLTNCGPCKETLLQKLYLGLAYDGLLLNNNCAKPNQSLDILKVAQPMCEDCGCGCD